VGCPWARVATVVAVGAAGATWVNLARRAAASGYTAVASLPLVWLRRRANRQGRRECAFMAFMILHFFGF
jgi:hypothetical protein